jgi:hypothetical protein
LSRHETRAVDRRPAGDVLLAFNSVTGGTRHNVRGGIAIAYRRADRAFPGALVVDPVKSSAPVVALAPDGTGIVAWSRPRHVYAISVDADGGLGAEKVFRTSSSVSGLHAAAGNDGAATLAWVSRPASAGPARHRVTTVRRRAGHVFGEPSTVTSTADVITTLVMAADDAGRVTLAWTQDHPGARGTTTAIASATAAPGRPFGTPREVAPPSGGYHTPPSIAAANGRVAIAWGTAADLRHIALKAAVGPAGAPGPPQTVTTKTLTRAIPAVPPVRATIDAGGTATVVYGEPVEATTGPAFSWRVLAVDGR